MEQTAPTRDPAGAPAAPTTYRVRARTQGKGRAVAEAADESIAFDASWAQPPSGLPGPAELLASAFAACLLKNIERAGHLLAFHYQSAEVDVAVRRQDAPPKFVGITYELRVVTDESDHRLELLHRNLRQFGTVYNTLAAACVIDGRILRVAPRQPE
jgi:uncharacterized OsmC-like protein